MLKKLAQRLGVQPGKESLLLTIYFAFFTSGMISIMLGTLLPDIRLFYSLDYTQSGMFLSAHQIGNLCSVLVAGALPYLLGKKGTALLLGIGSAIGLFAITFTGNPLLLIIAFACTGISRGMWSNVCNTVAGEVSSNQTVALNILHAMFAVGALISPFVIYFCQNYTTAGWQNAARFAGALSLLVLVTVACSKLAGKSEQKEKHQGKQDLSILKSASFWLVVGILFFYLGAESSIIGWLVTYFTENQALPATLALFTPTIIWGMVMLGRIFFASIAGKVNKKTLIVVLGVAFSVCFLIMLLANNAWVRVASLFGIGFFMSGIYPTTFSTIKNLSSTVANGLCLGIATFGAIIAPIVVGAVADWQGLTGGVTVIFFCCVAMLALMVINKLHKT